MMLNRRLVGVTAGLGTCNTLICTGIRKTAPETPTGVVTVARTDPAKKLSTSISSEVTVDPASSTIQNHSHMSQTTQLAWADSESAPTKDPPAFCAIGGTRVART